MVTHRLRAKYGRSRLAAPFQEVRDEAGKIQVTIVTGISYFVLPRSPIVFIIQQLGARLRKAKGF